MEEATSKSRKTHTEHESASSTNDVASITDVPDQVLMEICSKLSVKSICRFRSVCKHLFNLLTSPDFIQLHFDRSSVCPLICRASPDRYWSGGRRRRFCTKSLSLFEYRRDSTSKARDSSRLNLTAFKLPPRPPLLSCGLRGFIVVNSCNGYICLEAKVKSNTFRVAIYNPVTCEYSLLPFPRIAHKTKDQVFVSGLGYCPVSNQYKVLIFVDLQQEGCSTCFTKWSHCNTKVALIYTLGSRGGEWREIQSPPCCSQCSSKCPVFFNGALHWTGQTVQTLIYGTHTSSKTVNCIMIFDFEGEQFRILPEPPCKNSSLWSPDDMTLVVIRGRLYLCKGTNLIDMWVMNDSGVEKSWTKEERVTDTNYDGWGCLFGSNSKSSFFSNWDLLFYSPGRNSIYFIDKHRRSIRSQKIGERTHDLKVFAHVPSFISLRNVVGDSLEVLKFGST